MAMNHQRVREAFDACLVVVNAFGRYPKPARIEPDQRLGVSGGPRSEAFWSHLAFCCETGKVIATEAETSYNAGRQLMAEQDSAQAVEEFQRSKSRMEKAMRWLGFVQGVLWGGDYATLEELKKMNMPPFAEPESPLPVTPFEQAVGRAHRPTSTGEPREDER